MQDNEAKEKGKQVAKIIYDVMKESDSGNNTAFTQEVIKGLKKSPKMVQWDEVTFLIVLLGAMAEIDTDITNRAPVRLAGIAKQAIEKELGFPIKEII